MFRIGFLFVLASLAGYYWRDVVEFVAMFSGWYAFALLPLGVVCFCLFLGFYCLALCLDEEMAEEKLSRDIDESRWYWDN